MLVIWFDISADDKDYPKIKIKKDKPTQFFALIEGTVPWGDQRIKYTCQFKADLAEGSIEIRFLCQHDDVRKVVAAQAQKWWSRYSCQAWPHNWQKRSDVHARIQLPIPLAI